MDNCRAAFVLTLGLLVPASAKAQVAAGTGGTAESGYAQYVDGRKERLKSVLVKRLADIEKRYSEEQSFRAQLKEERVAFEKSLEKEQETFLESLKAMGPQDRGKSWEAFYQKLGRERREFSAKLRAKSQSFWKARTSGRDFGAAPEAKTP